MNPQHIERFLADSARYFGLLRANPAQAGRLPLWRRPSTVLAAGAALFSSLALALPTPRDLAASVMFRHAPSDQTALQASTDDAGGGLQGLTLPAATAHAEAVAVSSNCPADADAACGARLASLHAASLRR